jgi:hypothetical protein
MVEPNNTPRLPMINFIAVIPIAAFSQINSELFRDQSIVVYNDDPSSDLLERSCHARMLAGSARMLVSLAKDRPILRDSSQPLGS